MGVELLRLDRTGLLVSVRSAEEARVVLAGGVDVIDVKEPGRGALGAADREIVATIVEVVGGRVPVSVAGDELVDGGDVPVVAGVAYAKLGLAGCGAVGNWAARWREVIGGWSAPT